MDNFQLEANWKVTFAVKSVQQSLNAVILIQFIGCINKCLLIKLKYMVSYKLTTI